MKKSRPLKKSIWYLLLFFITSNLYTQDTLRMEGSYQIERTEVKKGQIKKLSFLKLGIVVLEREGESSESDVDKGVKYEKIEDYYVFSTINYKEQIVKFKCKPKGNELEVSIQRKSGENKNISIFKWKKNSEEIDEDIYVLVEEMPEFPGGQDAMLEFLYSRIIYPKIARENGIEGLVVISFIIFHDGSILNAEIKRDPGGGYCGEEAKRIVETMPNWEPGKQDGKPVSVAYNLPVRFQLGEKDMDK